MTWIDASDYFAQVEARQEPCKLTREDMVILALIDPGRVPGYCCSCGCSLDKAIQARWCDECFTIRARFQTTASELRRRRGAKLVNVCSTCGELYPSRQGPVTRCVPCQEAHLQKYNRDRMRRRYWLNKQEAMA